MNAPCPLSEKDLQLVRNLAEGKTRKDLSADMRVSAVMICRWVGDMCRKAGIKRRDTLLVATAIRNGWIE